MTDTPPVIDGLDHLVLTVADIEATCEFYHRVLGMEVIVFGENRTALGFGRQKINLHDANTDATPKASAPTPGSGDLCFLTEMPVDEVKAHVQSCGVDIEIGPVQRNGAIGPILSIYFRDPDGNLIEVANAEAISITPPGAPPPGRRRKTPPRTKRPGRTRAA